MPFVEEQPLFPQLQPERPEPEPVAAPGFFETLANGFRMENDVLNAVDFMSRRHVYEPDPTFNLGQVLKDNQLWEDRYNYYGVESNDEFLDRRNRIESERKTRERLAAAGWGGVLAQVAGGSVSPTLFLPLVGPGLRGRAALGFASSMGLLGAGLQEGVLYANQETRTGEEVAYSLAASTFLSGVLGTVAAHLRPNELERLAAQVEIPSERLEVSQPVVSGSGESVGAARVRVDAGGLKDGWANALSVISPVTRLLESESPMARWIAAQFSTAGLRLERNVDLIPGSAGGDIESLQKLYQGRLAQVAESLDENFNDYRLTPPGPFRNLRTALGSISRNGKMSKQEFKEEIGKYVHLDDEHPVPEIAKVVKDVKALYDEVFDEAKRVGLFKGETDLAGAQRYANIVYLTEAISRKRTQFVDLLAANARQKLEAEYSDRLNKLRESQARAKQQIEDLSRPAEEAKKLREEMLAELKKMEEEASPELKTAREEIEQLRAKLAAAKSKLDRKAIRAEIKLKKQQAGLPLEEFKTKGAALRRRVATLDRGRAVMEEKQLAKLNKAERNEELQIASLNRAVYAARKFLRLLDKTDDKNLKKEISSLKTQFAQEASRYDKLQEKEAALEDVDPAIQVANDNKIEVKHNKIIEQAAWDAVKPLYTQALNDTIAKFEASGKKLPPAIEKKLITALQSKKPEDWDILARARDLVEGNTKVPDEVVEFLDDLEEVLRGGAISSLQRQELKALRDSFPTMVAEYAKRDAEVLQDWLEAADTAEPGSPWWRPPVDRAAVEAALDQKHPGAKVTKAKDKVALRLNDIAQQLDEAESFDQAAWKVEIDDLINESLERVQNLNARRALRQDRLLKQAENLDPKLVDARIKDLAAKVSQRETDFIERMIEKGAEDIDLQAGRASFEKYSKEVAEDVTAKILGAYDRLPYTEIFASKRGPELARTLHIDPTFVHNGVSIADFREKDIERMLRIYIRTMSGDIPMMEKFGDTTMTQVMAQLADEENRVVDQVRTALGKDGKPLTQEAQEKRLNKITKQYEIMRNDLMTLMERVKHTRGIPDDPTGWATRGARMAMQLNALRFMGGVLLASVSDPANIVMKHGLTRTFRDGFLPFITDLKGMNLTKRQAKQAAVGVDTILHSRYHAISDVFDELRGGTKFEKGLEYASTKLGVIALFDQWTNTMKQITAGVVNARLMDELETVMTGKGSAKELAQAQEYLAAVGFNREIAERVWDQVTQRGAGRRVNGRLLPDTDNWDMTADGARESLRALRAALVKEADDTIVTPGLERPSWMDSSVPARMIGQFRSFGMSSTTKTLMAGLQQRDANFVNSTMISLALGSLSYYLWATATGGDAYEEMKKAGIDKWADEAIARSGRTAIFDEIQRFLQRIPATSQYSSFSGTRASRREGGDLTEALLGPSFDLLEKAGGVLVGLDDPTKSTLHKFRQMLPFQNLFYFRQALDAIEAAAGQNLPEKRQ